MIAEWTEYCALLNAVGGLRIVRNSTDNLRRLIRDEVAIWVSGHSLQKTSAAAFISKQCHYVSAEFCPYDTLATSQNSSVDF